MNSRSISCSHLLGASLLFAAVFGFVALPPEARARIAFMEESGTFADDTPYRMHLPAV
jgi:hypothetical protein